MEVFKMLQKYRTCWDVLIALGLVVALILVILFTVVLIRQSSENEQLTVHDLVQISTGLFFGVVLFTSSITYFCLQYRSYWQYPRRYNTDRKYKPVVVIGGSTCAICLNEKDTVKQSVVLLSCQHAFHKSCAKEWIDNKEDATCPNCRANTEAFKKSEFKAAMSEETSFVNRETQIVDTPVV